MSSKNYTHVYKPDGTWYCQFIFRDDAVAWVKNQPESDKWEVSNRVPPKKGVNSK